MGVRLAGTGDETLLSYDLAHWSAFLAAATLLNLAPGPDMVFILGHTALGLKHAATTR